MDDYADFRRVLLAGSDDQIVESLNKIVREWPDVLEPINVLKALDFACRYALASGFVINALRVLFDSLLKEKNTTYEEVVKLATWRSDV